MVESSDLQGAIQRTQAMERIQALQAQQDELNKKRFELEMERQRAEKRKKVQDAQKAESKRVNRDTYDGRRARPEDTPQEEPDTHVAEEHTPGEPPDQAGGRIDVRA